MSQLWKDVAAKLPRSKREEQSLSDLLRAGKSEPVLTISSPLPRFQLTLLHLSSSSSIPILLALLSCFDTVSLYFGATTSYSSHTHSFYRQTYSL